MDLGQQDGALSQPSWFFSHSLPPSHAVLMAYFAPHGPARLQGVRAAESRVHVRTPTWSVETVPLRRPLPNHLFSPPQLGIHCPSLHHAMAGFRVGVSHSQDLLSTQRLLR